jgi:ABC-type oligopeptide transport system substrate-binding subunit
MKKLISLLLLTATLAVTLAGCGSTLEKDEKGAVINVYIGSEISDFDPALAYTDDSAVKFLGLIYEGLTRINSKGKVENALMKSYKIIEDESKNDYRMQITIKNTKWNDGREVQADDIVYAWKRILDPEFSCSAAALLYDIKNARDVKHGDNSIDDLGLAAIDNKVIEIQFEKKIDYNLFLENLACLALVPLREDVVTRYENFGTVVTSLTTNGPFSIKGIEFGKQLLLERNVYYYRDTKNDDALDKYVIPYRMITNYADDEEANTVAYENGNIFYLGEIGLSKRAEYASKATVTDLLSTHSYIFNTTNKLFKDASVRKALSMALDRNEIAKIVTFAKPATGIIPEPVFDKAVGDSFRKNGGDLISATADVSGAKALLGGNTGSFTLTVKDNAVNNAIAEYCKSVWEGLGFKVKIESLNAKEFKKAYESANYDVIAVDYQCLSTDSFTSLAVFSPTFSGNAIDIEHSNYEDVPYIPGYNSEAFNNLINSASQETDRAARSQILHDAEKQLMEDMPIIPIVFNQDAYVFNSDVLSGIKDNYYGYRIFNSMKMKNWRDYQTTAAK